MADRKSENVSYRIRPMRREDLPQAAVIEQTCFTSEAWSEKVYREEFARAGTYLWFWAAVAQETISGTSGKPSENSAFWHPEYNICCLQHAAVQYNVRGENADGVFGRAAGGTSGDGPDEVLRLPEPAGELLLGTISLMRAGDEGEIGNVAVLSAYRRQGIAGALLKEAMEFGRREQGMQAFTLEVRAGNTAALRLYEAAGFRSEGRRPGFYTDPAEDALILWKRDA